MGGLTTTHIYYLMVLEPRGLKLRYLQGHTPFEGSREESSVPLPASGSSQRSLALPAQRQSLLPFHAGCFRKICWKDKLEKPKLAFCFCFSFLTHFGSLLSRRQFTCITECSLHNNNMINLLLYLLYHMPVHIYILLFTYFLMCLKVNCKHLYTLPLYVFS